nr:MAG TPA: hypothetical protein [Caudoviricetes sp.]
MPRKSLRWHCLPCSERKRCRLRGCAARNGWGIIWCRSQEGCYSSLSSPFPLVISSSIDSGISSSGCTTDRGAFFSSIGIPLLLKKVRQRLCLRLHIGTLNIIPLVHLLLPAGPALLLRIHAGGDVHVHALFLADCLDCHAILIKTICHTNSPSLSLVFVCGFFLNFRQALDTNQQGQYAGQYGGRQNHRPFHRRKHRCRPNRGNGGLCHGLDCTDSRRFPPGFPFFTHSLHPLSQPDFCQQKRNHCRENSPDCFISQPFPPACGLDLELTHLAECRCDFGGHFIQLVQNLNILFVPACALSFQGPDAVIHLLMGLPGRIQMAVQRLLQHVSLLQPQAFIPGVKGTLVHGHNSPPLSVWDGSSGFHFLPKLRACLRGPGVGVNLAAPGFAICGTAIPFGVGGSGEGEEGQRLVRVSGPDKPPLGGQLLRLLGIDFTVVDLEEPNHPPGAGPADKAIFLACLALQHVFGSLGRLEVRDILLCGTEFRAGHGGGFCLQVDCGRLPRPAQGIQNKLFFSQRHSLLLELLPP